MRKFIVMFLVLVFASVACGTPAEEWQLRGWTVTPHPTSLETLPTETPLPTQTPFIVEITNTPLLTSVPVNLCVNAEVAVYLRPSASDENYPIMPLPNDVTLTDLGGRSENWIFVSYEEKQGWVHGDYVGDCQ
jgi:hypothetical protein